MSLFEMETQPIPSNLLSDRFLVPPFSILDTKQGYWQDRKRTWLKITGNLSETRNGEFGTVSGNNSNNIFARINEGTSNFDPVLAELVYRWFCIPNGKILDPFGGEQTKGVVAGALGYKYQAVEIRQDQVNLNNDKVRNFDNVKYFCGDSNNIDNIILDNDFDLCFTSPPYYDLEVYSKDDMSALGSYEEFMQQYKNIFTKCFNKLKEDSFLVVKVGEIRDKNTGEYRCFVPDNVKIMQDIGFKYYNEIILINAIGTLPFRISKQFNSGRKIGKQHQNVLVFYKGDLKNIKNKFKDVEVNDIEYEL